MKPIFVVFACSLLLFSCSAPPPDKYFSTTILSANSLYGFAGEGMHRELASPSVKLVDQKTMESAPMTRAEVLENRFSSIEEGYKRIKSLPDNAEAMEMLNASKAVFEYAIPVYENEYKELAALYDSKAAPEKIEALEKTIVDKYQGKFLELYEALGTAGKAYAAKNNIQMREVSPSPGKY